MVFKVVEELKIGGGLLVEGLIFSFRGCYSIEFMNGKKVIRGVCYVRAQYDYDETHLMAIPKVIDLPEEFVGNPCALLYDALKLDYAEFTVINL